MLMKARETIPSEKIHQALADLTAYLLGKFDFTKDEVALVGIQTRGAILATRIAERIAHVKNVQVPIGDIDITLYRDDLGTSGIQPTVRETHLDFDIDDKHIVLVDDVLFTGRTVRAAIDELIDFGRPRSIALVVLVDRGHRELPIAADFAPIKIPTKRNESVDLYLTEIDKKEEIVVYEGVRA
jgi:pyrimidine operon attenuation protein/uracil phosphoribosyltransferase